jgi:hypothetical protein
MPQDLKQKDPQPAGSLAAMLGGLIVVLAIVFIVSGGTLTGNTKVSGDDDLPPVASTADAR